MDDWQLLNEYATEKSEVAFGQLVDRYAGMVYHAALREVGRPDAAEEITQAVFIALSRKAGNISRRTTLYGWLFRATRFGALNLLREESCRRRHEQEFLTMQGTIASNDAESVCDQVLPHLNGALERLSKADREVVMMRFFGNQSHKDLARLLGVSEDTAKKRLSRAIERLRVIFAKHGLAVSSVALVAALAANGAQAAPQGLAAAATAAAVGKGASGAVPALSTAKGILKLMAWAKMKTMIAVTAGVLLAAGGTTVAIKAVNTPVEDVVSRLARDSGQRIVCEKRLHLPVTLDLKNLSLPEALDALAVQAGAYWTVDYAVYGSDRTLQRLVQGLQDGAELQHAGWTNLSGVPLHANIGMEMHTPGTRSSGGGFVIPKGVGPSSGTVSMQLVLGPEASMELVQGGNDAFSTIISPINHAIKDGQANGVLAPERLLADSELMPRVNLVVPMPATSESAARTAKAAHAHWVTLYTLRKSPLDGAGIKLVHNAVEAAYVLTNVMSQTEVMDGVAKHRFDLTPEERAAHERAVEALKRKR